DVGVGDVHLFMHHIFEHGGKEVKASFFVIQQGSESGRRVKVGTAHEINRAVHAHKGDGIKVSYDSIIFYGAVGCAHGFFVSENKILLNVAVKRCMILSSSRLSSAAFSR